MCRHGNHEIQGILVDDTLAHVVQLGCQTCKERTQIMPTSHRSRSLIFLYRLPKETWPNANLIYVGRILFDVVLMFIAHFIQVDLTMQWTRNEEARKKEKRASISWCNRYPQPNCLGVHRPTQAGIVVHETWRSSTTRRGHKKSIRTWIMDRVAVARGHVVTNAPSGSMQLGQARYRSSPVILGPNHGTGRLVWKFGTAPVRLSGIKPGVWRKKKITQ